MVPSGRKHAGKSGKAAKAALEEQAVRVHGFDKDDRNALSGSTEERLALEGRVSQCPCPPAGRLL